MLTGEIFYVVLPANDYIFQKDTYEYRIDRAVEYIRNADCILIERELVHQQLPE